MWSTSANFLRRKLATGVAKNARSGPKASRSGSLASTAATKYQSSSKVRSSLCLPSLHRFHAMLFSMMIKQFTDLYRTYVER